MNEARYFRVGLFVFAGIALVLAGVITLAGGNLFRTPLMLETFFDESVTGLEIGSPVSLRGVRIGSVSFIGFADDVYRFSDPEARLTSARKILVLMEIVPPSDDDFVQITEEQRRQNIQKMIDDGLRLRVAAAGITGGSYIQADFVDPQRHPPMELAWQPKHLYIPSAPSTLSALTTAAERIFQRLEETRIEDVVNHLDELLVDLNTKVAQVDTRGLGRSARQALDQANSTLANAERAIQGGTFDLHAALENVRVASEDLRALTAELRSQPSLLLRSTAPENRPVTP